MEGKGTVELKKKYLGDVFPGQLLCWCVIEIGENAVSVSRFKGGHLAGSRWFDDASAVAAIKSKLRAFVASRRGSSRWALWATKKPGTARLTVYYPEREWAAGMRNPSYKSANSGLL